MTRGVAHLAARLGTVVGTLVLAVGVPVLGPVAPASAAACTGTSGVTVVVGSTVGCAPGDPSSALAALTAAGHTTTMVERLPGVLCQVDGSPSSPCVVMPPSSAYWSFWVATRGGRWSYASTGLTTYRPAPGTVVGVAFGAGSPPPVAPPAAAGGTATTALRQDTRPASLASPATSPWPVAGGITLVLALGGATAYVARRRRG